MLSHEELAVEMEMMEETTPEQQMMHAAENGRWEDMLEAAERLGPKAAEDALGRCLERALLASPEVFDRLLELLPGREYVAKTLVAGAVKGYVAQVHGTLVTLAAARGKEEHLQCLLRRGWDVNSASLDAACRLTHSSKGLAPYYKTATEWFEPYAARPESKLELTLPMEEWGGWNPVQEMLSGVTPLAAAVLCGREECVRILLEHGAWREEAPSVARALTCYDRKGDAAYQACREAVLSYGDAPRLMALWAVLRRMQEKQLEAELHRCRYDEEAICRVVWEITSTYRVFPRRSSWEEEKKRDLCRLKILERHYPQVLRRGEVVSLLLRWIMLQNSEDPWLEFVLKICPEEVDLSLIREGFVRMPARRARAFLLRLCQGRRCIMDRDGVPPTTPVSVLQTLLQNVEFLPPVSGLGVSGLSYAILNSGNLQLIRKALKTGAVSEAESTALLLRCIGEIPWASMARTLLLTMPHRQVEEAQLRSECRKELPYGPMFRWQPPEVRDADYRILLQEDCPEELEKELILRGLYDYRGSLKYETAEGAWEVGSLLNLLCWTGRHEQVERWVRCGSKDLLKRYDILRPAGSAYTLCATPLCIAAFAGQREVVEVLLRHGAEVQEQRCGAPSVLRCDGGEFVLTPLLAAIVQGHWEVARLLIDHGAVCDPEQHAVQRLWSLYHEEDLHQAVQVYLAGYFLQAEKPGFLTV